MNKPTFIIENAKTKFFASKEEYLQFRKSWKDFVNSGGEGDSIHHFIYLALRGKDIYDGYTQITNKNKLVSCGFHKYQGLVLAFNNFCTAMKSYKRYSAKTIKADYEKTYIAMYEEMAKPFGISMEKLEQLALELENITIDSDGNIHRKETVIA